MILKTYILSIYFLLATGFFEEASFDQKDLVASNTYEITVSHPGIEESEVMPSVLYEIQGEDGKPIQYFMDVESVFCAEDICQVVPVRLNWDAWGNYLSYDTEQGGYLEKGKGEPFDTDDYKLLDQILQNKHSIFEGMAYDEISTASVHGDVDGFSGATSVTLSEDESVVGAAWTCYTLWHWVHGGVTKHIRRISISQLSSSEWLEYINSSHQDKKESIMEHLSVFPVYEDQLLSTVKEQCITWTGDLTKFTVDYLSQADRQDFQSISLSILKTINHDQRIHYLHMIDKRETELESLFIENLSEVVTATPTFDEVHVLMRLLEKRSILSDQTFTYVTHLLDSDQWLIARQAYWFLASQKLDKSHQVLVKQFEKKHEDRL